MHSLSGAHACTDEDKRADIKLLQQIRQVCGKDVIVNGLGDGLGTHPIAVAESASVRGNAAESISFTERESQLLEHDGGHWPAVEEDEGRLLLLVADVGFIRPERGWKTCWLVVTVEEVTFVEGADEARHGDAVVW